MVDINTQNTNFVDGQVTVGFGTGDVTVNHLWVIGPTHLQANVVVAPNAVLGASEFSVVLRDSRWLRSRSRFRTQAGESEPAFIGLPIVNAVPTQQTLYPGAFRSHLRVEPGAFAKRAQVNVEQRARADPVRLGDPDQIRDSPWFSDWPSHAERE